MGLPTPAHHSPLPTPTSVASPAITPDAQQVVSRLLQAAQVHEQAGEHGASVFLLWCWQLAVPPCVSPQQEVAKFAVVFCSEKPLGAL